ncbi:hypothetical protein CR513_00175, partial [Mucuna pruriens]
MDVKIVFLNGDINKMIYMVQLESFVPNDSKFGMQTKEIHLWPQIGFSSMVSQIPSIDDCVYHTFNGSKYIFLVLYVNDILLANSDTCLFHETKRFFMNNFKMKDLVEAFLFDMKDSKLGDTPIVKGDKFSLKQCTNNGLERNKMQKIPYALIVESLMYP